MKVLHVIPSVSSLRGGPSQAVLQMVKALRQHGIETEIATTNDDGPGLLDVPLRQLTPYPVDCPAPVRFFARFSPGVAAIREFAFSADLTRWLWQHLREYDLVHVHAIFSYPSTAAMAIARLQGIPYIVRPLGQLCQWSLQQGRQKKQLYLNLIEHANLKQARAIHFTSEQEQQEAAHLNLPPSFVLSHGLQQSVRLPDARCRLRQTLHLPADEPIVLFLSRLHPKKGLDYLIPALGRLHAHRFTFVLAGNAEPAYETEVTALLQAAGIEGRTCRLGFVTGELKHLLLQGADLFTLTSHSENFGIAVLEALAAGLPVLVTPGVALASLVNRSQLGWVVDLEVTAIATALQECLNTPQETRRMGDRACQIIREQFTWEAVAASLIQHYRSAINNTPLPQERELNSLPLPSGRV